MYVDGEMERGAQEALLDAVAGPAFFVDRDYRYLAFNEAHRRAVRDLYGTEVAIGESLLDTVALPDDRDTARANLDRALAGDTHSSGAWYGLEPGVRRFYTVTYAPALRDAVAGVAAVAVDATDLADARADLERANARLVSEREFARTLVENLADGVVACDAEGWPILRNRAAREAHGIGDVAEVTAEWPPGDAVYGPDGMPLDREDAPLTRALRGEHPKDQPFTIKDPGSAPRAILASGDSFCNEAGEKIGAVVVLHDVTERNSIVEALRLSEQKFEAAFRASPDAININRMSDGLYLEVNAGFTALTGFTAQDVKGRTSRELSVWDDLADRDRLVTGLRSDGCVDKLEARFKRKDGSLTTAEMSARIIDVGGEPCILSVTRDVSERKTAQAALEESYEHLERMSRDMVQTLGRVVEARDPYTQGHEERAAELCRLIAMQMGMSDEDVEVLETAALVHDIGKLRVPAEILNKPGELSKLEYDLIKEHPRHGYEILKGIAFEWPIADLVLQHHERMDGSGYPRGAGGDEIAMPARILAIADVVEAMATDRPYRAALGLDAAVDELRAHPEKYDPRVVAAFFALCGGGCIKL